MSQKIAPCPASLSIFRFSSITPQPLDWLWPHYLPKGKLSLLLGDPASGKTALTLDLAARLSTNSPMPPNAPAPNPPLPSPPSTDGGYNVPSQPTKSPTHQNPAPQNSPRLSLTPSPCPPLTPSATLLLSPEDNAADTLRPRLDALGANTDLIHLLPDLHSLTSDSHIEALTDVLEEIPNLSLLVIDPITYYLGQTDRLLHSPDAYTSPSVLHALAQLAHRFHIAILLTSRLPKPIDLTAPNALRRTLATLPYASITRTIHLLSPYTPSPSATADGYHLLTHTASPPANHTGTPQNHSLTPSPCHPLTPTSLLLPLKSPSRHLPPPLAFSLSEPLTWHPAPIPLEDLSPPPDPVLQQTADFLRTLLADGPKPAREIQNITELNVISRSSLHRAKTFLKIKPFRVGLQGPWYWSLPGDIRKPPAPTSPMLPDNVNALTQLLGVLTQK